MRALLVALAVAAALPVAASGPSHAGALRLSGGTGYAYSSTSYGFEGTSEELKLKTQSAGAEGVYLFLPYAGAGASVQYAKTTLSFPLLAEDSTDEAWVAGPVLALELPMDRVVLRAEAGWMWGRSTPVGGSGLETMKSSGWVAAAGVGFLLAPAISIDLGVRYTSLGGKFQGVDTTVSTFSASVGFSVYLGGHGGGAAASAPDASGPLHTTGAGNPSPW